MSNRCIFESLDKLVEEAGESKIKTKRLEIVESFNADELKLFKKSWYTEFVDFDIVETVPEPDHKAVSEIAHYL